MKKPQGSDPDYQINPFLTDRAEILWEKIDKGGKPVTKEELLERIRQAKRKNK